MPQENQETPATEDELWNQVQQDRSTPPAEDAAPAADEKPAATEAPPATETPEPPAAADPLAGLPEATRKLLEGLQTKSASAEEALKQAKRQLATQHGVAGSLKQQLEKTQAKLQEILPTVQAVEDERKRKAKEDADAKAKKRDELRESLGDRDPELLEYLDEVAKPADEKPQTVEPVKTEPNIEQPVIEQPKTPDEMSREKRLELMVALSEKVPGWMQTRETPEFKAWTQGTGKAVYQAKIGSWDVDEVAQVFTAFTKHQTDAAQVAKVEKERQDRLRRGEGIVPRGSSTGNVDTSDDALWEKVKRDREKLAAA